MGNEFTKGGETVGLAEEFTQEEVNDRGYATLLGLNPVVDHQPCKNDKDFLTFEDLNDIPDAQIVSLPPEGICITVDSLISQVLHFGYDSKNLITNQKLDPKLVDLIRQLPDYQIAQREKEAETLAQKAEDPTTVEGLWRWLIRRPEFGRYYGELTLEDFNRKYKDYFAAILYHTNSASEFHTEYVDIFGFLADIHNSIYDIDATLVAALIIVDEIIVLKAEVASFKYDVIKISEIPNEDDRKIVMKFYEKCAFLVDGNWALIVVKFYVGANYRTVVEKDPQYLIENPDENIRNLAQPILKFSRTFKGILRQLYPITETYDILVSMSKMYIDKKVVKQIENSKGRSLDLHEMKLGSMPAIIPYFKNISYLNLEGNKLKVLLPEIVSMIKLENLNVSNNELEYLPDNIGDLFRLEKLDVGGNKLTSLPVSIGKLGFLDEFEFSNNKIESLPTTIGEIAYLKIIRAHRNKFKDIPKELNNLKNLSVLGFSHNEISTLPESINNFEKIEELDISYNQIENLPYTIGGLVFLKRFHAEYNKLKSLPDSIEHWAKLETLVLTGNRLTSLPDSIGKLTKLKELYINYNLLTSIPHSIVNLKNLKRTSFYGNNFSESEKIFIIEFIENLDGLGKGGKYTQQEIDDFFKKKVKSKPNPKYDAYLYYEPDHDDEEIDYEPDPNDV